MLSSSFSRDNESVFVDILTFSDLEMLKARKLGSSTGSSMSSHSMSASGAGVKQYQKRYVILTYCSEFDRVHYPLPLSFEDTPNVAALRRTISRLRKELHEKAQEAQEPANEREK
jgi:coiled-coil domain-containing protein 61